MKVLPFLFGALALAPWSALHSAELSAQTSPLVAASIFRPLDSLDPFLPYLDGKPPEILREIPPDKAAPENITVQHVVYRLFDDSEIFAVIAKPKAPGKYPGMLVFHGSGGVAEGEKAMAWAQRGYVAIAPDLPGLADPKKFVHTKGRWNALKFGEGRYTAEPEVKSSVIFDGVVSAMKSLYLLQAQPEVDRSRIGVVGVSYGGYMTTMVCGLAGDQVRAGFSVFGCGFFEYTAQGNTTLAKMGPAERERWLRYLDAGRRSPNTKASLFIAAAANDFFFFPKAVQATLDAVPGEKNHVFAPNANHKITLPGGSVFPNKPTEPFVPTPFQPLPTPSGNKANWVAMEVPFFDLHLKDQGEPFPKVKMEKPSDPLLARVSVQSPTPITNVDIHWAKANPDVLKREWLVLPTTKSADNIYEARLPAEAADWFAVASDARPVSVSSDLVSLPNPAPADSK